MKKLKAIALSGALLATIAGGSAVASASDQVYRWQTMSQSSTDMVFAIAATELLRDPVRCIGSRHATMETTQCENSPFYWPPALPRPR